MLPGGTDSLYRSALAAGSGHVVRLEVWSGLGFPLETLIPAQFRGEPEGGLCFYNATVSATLNSRVTRELQFSVPYDMYPLDPGDLLAPFGNEIRAFRGIRLGDGSDFYTWQVFRGRIRQTRQYSSGNVTVICTDRASDVVDNQFVSPQNSQPSNSIYAEFQRLVIDAVTDATFGASDLFDSPVQQLTWELDRGAALDEMARSAGALWYCLANGDFVMRRFPWTQEQLPVVTLSTGLGGTIGSWEALRDRNAIYNVVTVTGERLDGQAPVYGTAADENPASPTYINGGFGVRSLLDRLQTPSTPGGAEGAARERLAASIAPVEAFQLRCSVDPSLELGDAVTLDIEGREVLQVVSALSVPLGVDGDMFVSTRSMVINELEG
jgi:Domain of unknown function (DUF5047)